MKKIITILAVLIGVTLNSQTIQFKQLQRTSPVGILKSVITGTDGALTFTSTFPISFIPTLPAYQPTITGGYLTPSNTASVTNKSGQISMWTNDAAYTTTAAIGGSFVPLTRSLTINGTAYDLSANRTWTVGDLFSSSTYSNPSWLSFLDWNKIVVTPTTLSGYGITDGITASSVAATYVPFTGAGSGLNLNTQNLSTSGQALLTATNNIDGNTQWLTPNASTVTVGSISGTMALLSDAGFTIKFNNTSNNFTGTQFLGGLTAVSTGSNIGLVSIPYNTTLVGWCFTINTTTGTAESATLSVVAGGTNNVLSSAIIYSSSPVMYSGTLSVNVNANVPFNMKHISPSWGTPPTTSIIGLILYFVRRT